MRVDAQALEGAKKALRIFDVYFRDEMVHVLPEMVPQFELPDQRRVQFKMETRLLHDFEIPAKDDTAVRRMIEIEFTGSVRCVVGEEGSESYKELINMEITLGLIYDMKEECLAESLDEFIRANAPYHAIPYWREHVHCVCAKRRLPAITVPMYTKLPPLVDGKASLESNGA